MIFFLYSKNNLIYYVAGAGDCRAVLSKNGIAIPLSKDHRPHLESERILKAGGWIHDGRLNGVLGISRGFGDIEYKIKKEESWECKFHDDLVISEPDITRGDIDEDTEFILLASDGLFDVLNSQEAINYARKKLVESNDIEFVATAIIKKVDFF